jgi:hypothetical protein
MGMVRGTMALNAYAKIAVAGRRPPFWEQPASTLADWDVLQRLN